MLFSTNLKLPEHHLVVGVSKMLGECDSCDSMSLVAPTSRSFGATGLQVIPPSSNTFLTFCQILCPSAGVDVYCRCWTHKLWYTL